MNRSRISTIRSVLMGVLFIALAAVAFVLLFMRGWTLPLGLVLFGRLAFVAVEGHLGRGRWRGLPLMVRMGLVVHLVLASAFTLAGLGQVFGLV